MTNSSKSLTGFKALLFLLLITLVVYTFFTIQNDGINFFGKAATYVQSLEWSGQFSVDFLCYLILSALWVAWRGAFSGQALFLGLLASIGGFLFLSIYLLILISKHQGDLRKVLLGEQI